MLRALSRYGLGVALLLGACSDERPMAPPPGTQGVEVVAGIYSITWEIRQDTCTPSLTEALESVAEWPPEQIGVRIKPRGPGYHMSLPVFDVRMAGPAGFGTMIDADFRAIDEILVRTTLPAGFYVLPGGYYSGVPGPCTFTHPWSHAPFDGDLEIRSSDPGRFEISVATRWGARWDCDVDESQLWPLAPEGVCEEAFTLVLELVEECPISEGCEVINHLAYGQEVTGYPYTDLASVECACP